MASKLKIKVNGLVHSVTASLDTPLLYVLHNELHLHGPRFGCGLAQCGACSVLLDGKEIRSCVTPVAAVSGKAITTLEGLPAMWAKERGTTAASPALHPLQQAWIDVQVPHCGYCQNGMMIQAADLLSTTKNPTEDQIRTAMNGHLCRCGTYPRILTAIKQAATWISVLSHNTITFKTSQIECGNGVTTGLCQLVAEEMNVPASQVHHVFWDSWNMVNSGSTGGSTGIQSSAGPPLRSAAATAMQALFGLASANLGVPVGSLSVKDGVVSGGGKTVTYGQLVAGKL